MARTLTTVALILLLISVVLSHDQARAQGPMGQWIFDTIINPDVEPLEISGGPVFPGIDTFIVLDDNDRSNLMVYNINRSTRSVESTSTIPVNTPAFGLGHVIRSANNTAHSCFTDNFELFAVHSPNGVDWDKVPVTEFKEYDSCETAVNNGDVFVGACNVDADAYLIFQSQDNGQTWNKIQEIENVLCPSQDGTRPTFNMIDGVPVIFYMTGFSEEEAVEKDQSNTTRLIAPGELVLQQGNEPHVVDMDTPHNTLAESFPSKTINGTIYTAYYHRASNTIRLLVKNPPPFGLPIVVELGPPAPFTTFFGLACVEGPKGTINVIAPGKHFQYVPIFDPIDTGAGEVFQISRFPFMNQNNGPVGVTDFAPPPGFVRAEEGFDAMYPGSLGFGQFRLIGSRPIPTLSEWGLIALAGVLMLSGAFYLRRRVMS